MKIPQRPPGVSLVITIIFTSIFLLVVIGVGQSTVFSLREIGNFARFDQLFHISRGINEVSQLSAEKQLSVENGTGVGFEARDVSITCPDTTGLPPANFICGMVSEVDSDLTVTISLNTIARPNANALLSFNGDAWYSVPLAYLNGTFPQGTGTVSSDCQIDADFNGNITDDDTSNANNPCHWNFLSPGEIIEIPLFYDDNPADALLANVGDGTNPKFIFRVRTPCEIEGQTYCPATGPASRVKLSPFATPPDQRHWRRDPTLISWQLIRENDSLLANQELEAGGTGLRTAANTEIFGTLINETASDGFIVLDENSQGESESSGNLVSIQDFLDDIGTNERAYFRFQLAAIPKDQSWISLSAEEGNLDERQTNLQNLVPYLEYQVLFDRPVTDDKRLSRVTVTAGNISQTTEKQGYLPLTPTASSLEEL